MKKTFEVAEKWYLEEVYLHCCKYNFIRLPLNKTVITNYDGDLHHLD